MKIYAALLPLTAVCLFYLVFLPGTVLAQKLDPFKNANGKYGYKSNSGVIVVPAKYQQAEYFIYSDFAAVKLNNKWGFIDETGKEVIIPKYDSVGKGSKRFSGDYLEVRLNGKWGIVNKNGKEVVPENTRT
jgi:hypothetical protein